MKRRLTDLENEIESDRKSSEPTFAVEVLLRRDVAVAEELSFQRRLDDWLQAHDLWPGQGQLKFQVRGDHELTPTDQANLLLALVDDPAVQLARVGPVVHGHDPGRAPGDLVWVEARKGDPLVQAARQLYEAARLDGRGLLEALGGYLGRRGAADGAQP